MVENPRSAANKNLRWSASSDDAVTIDYPIKCNDKCCRSCAAGMIADSVAICCCPCSVISFLALALVKAPLMICRRCLGFSKNERRRRDERNKKRICERERSSSNSSIVVEKVEEGTSEIVFAIGDQKEENGEDEEQKENLSGRFEAEKIWLELHQLGHLGFGRVSSFTGITSLPKGN